MSLGTFESDANNFGMMGMAPAPNPDLIRGIDVDVEEAQFEAFERVELSRIDTLEQADAEKAARARAAFLGRTARLG